MNKRLNKPACFPRLPEAGRGEAVVSKDCALTLCPWERRLTQSVRKRRQGLSVWFLIVLLTTLVAKPAIGADDRLAVYVTNYPLQYFAQRIGGEQVEAVLPAPADIDPAYWKPKPYVIAAYQRADLILLNGADYEKWVAKSSLPRAKLIDTASAFKDRVITTENVVTHSHGPGGQHSHTGTAFTTWLDLSLAIEHAQAVAAALSAKRPAQAEQFRRNAAALRQDLESLDQTLKRLITGARTKTPVLGSHPVYDYLARRYGINLKSLHWEPDVMPSAEEWGKLAELRKTHPAKWMLWEAAPAPEIAARLQALGIGSVVVSPCANRPAEGDFLAVMQANVERLGRVYSGP